MSLQQRSKQVDNDDKNNDDNNDDDVEEDNRSCSQLSRVWRSKRKSEDRDRNVMRVCVVVEQAEEGTGVAIVSKVCSLSLSLSLANVLIVASFRLFYCCSAGPAAPIPRSHPRSAAFSLNMLSQLRINTITL